MNARVVLTLTAKVYLGSDLDPTGTVEPGPNRYPDVTKQVVLTLAFGFEGVPASSPVDFAVYDLARAAVDSVRKSVREDLAKASV